MSPKISREDTLEMIKDSTKYDHLLRVGKIMKCLAHILGQDEDEWELVGLLHDLDFDLTVTDCSHHGLVATQLLETLLPEQALNAIRSHDYRTGVPATSLLTKVLISADALDVFIGLLHEQGVVLQVSTLLTELDNW
ncbi:MAG: HD domain-containing protein [Candidatus Heimdallarchaeota archaeon]|nr:HD domain-containing protein [Candidatus Heimdallarchaeota archaeon]